MQASELDEFAHMMLSAYLATAAFSRKFTKEWDTPPTAMTKAHHLRSVVQAQIGDSERYELHKEYVEFGRVQVTDTDLTRTFLLRSMSAVSIEEAQVEWTLFDVKPKLDTALLIYRFDPPGLSLWHSATTRSSNSRRLLPAGAAQSIGFWRFDDLPTAVGLFDQGETDAFDDLGNPDIEASGEADES
jgi:hypothetical protein